MVLTFDSMRRLGCGWLQCRGLGRGLGYARASTLSTPAKCLAMRKQVSVLAHGDFLNLVDKRLSGSVVCYDGGFVNAADSAHGPVSGLPTRF